MAIKLDVKISGICKVEAANFASVAEAEIALKKVVTDALAAHASGIYVGVDVNLAR